MWNISNTFGSKSTQNFSQPDYVVNLYDDSFTFQSSGFGTGTLGTMAGFFFYDIKNKKNSAETGTSWFSANIQMNGTLLNGYFGAGTAHVWGTWISPIITPFYKATWDYITVDDFNFDNKKDTNLICYEGFESNLKMLNNNIIAHGSYVFVPGNTGNAIQLVGSNSFISISNKNISTLLNEGHVQLKFQAFQKFDQNLIFFLNGTRGASLSIAVIENSVGTYINLWHARNDGTYTLQQSGSLLYTRGSWHNIFFSWYPVGSNLAYVLNVNGIEKIGTFNGTMNDISKTIYVGMNNTNYGTILLQTNIDEFYLSGSKGTSGSMLTVNYGSLSYSYRLSDDGTSFTNWLDVGNNFNTYDKNVVYSLAGSQANYAQFQIGLFSAFTMGFTGNSYVSSFAPHCTFQINSNNITDIGNVDKKLSNDIKIGLVDAGGITAKFSNAKSPYLGKQKLFGDNL